MSALPEEVVQGVSRRSSLSPNLALWIVVAATGLLFSQTLVSLVRVWRESADYNHGFLIALISLVTLFRARIDAATVRPNLALLPVLVLALLAWMIAYRANSEMLQQVAFPIVLMLAITSAFGVHIARLALFPVGFFCFAIPIWDHLIPLLQMLSTATAETVLGALGIPTQVEGFSVAIPEGRFSIVEGCSGKRYLIIALALAALAAVTQGVRGRRLAVLFALAIGGALVTNWVRIIIVIYAGHVSNMQHYLVAVEHVSLGYAMYVPLIAAIVFAARRWGSPQVEPPARPAPQVDATTVIRGSMGVLAPMVVAASVLMVTAPATEARASLAQPPLLTATWQGPLPADSVWSPLFAGAQAELRASYGNRARRIEIYVNAYGTQTHGAELVQFDNTVVPTDEWTIVRPIEIRAPLDALIATSNSDTRWIIAKTYAVGGRLIESPGAAQLLYGWRALRRPVPAGVLALAIRCEADCDAAAAALVDFWDENEQSLVAMIPGKF